MSDKTHIDAEESALISAYEHGEFVPVENQAEAMAQAQAMAGRYLQKNTPHAKACPTRL